MRRASVRFRSHRRGSRLSWRGSSHRGGRLKYESVLRAAKGDALDRRRRFPHIAHDRHRREPGAVRSGLADLHARRCTDSPEVLPTLSSAEQHRADAAADLRTGQAVGAVNPGEGREPRDAAVVHRPQRRRSQVQGRSVADRRRDRHHHELGRPWRSAGQPRRHATVNRLGTDRSLEHQTQPDRESEEGHRCQSQRLGSVVGSRDGADGHDGDQVHQGD